MIDRETERQRERGSERQRERQGQGQTGRQIDRGTERDRYTFRQTDNPRIYRDSGPPLNDCIRLSKGIHKVLQGPYVVMLKGPLRATY